MAVLMPEHRVNNADWSSNEAGMASWAPTVAVNDIAMARRKERSCCKAGTLAVFVVPILTTGA